MKKQVLLFSAVLWVSGSLMTGCVSNTRSDDQTKTEQATDEHESPVDETANGESDSTEVAYACPMHPEVTGKKGDKCSKCGMALAAVD